jgi:hypothetical protein
VTSLRLFILQKLCKNARKTDEKKLFLLVSFLAEKEAEPILKPIISCLFTY